MLICRADWPLLTAGFWLTALESLLSFSAESLVLVCVLIAPGNPFKEVGPFSRLPFFCVCLPHLNVFLLYRLQIHAHELRSLEINDLYLYLYLLDFALVFLLDSNWSILFVPINCGERVAQCSADTRCKFVYLLNQINLCFLDFMLGCLESR